MIRLIRHNIPVVAFFFAATGFAMAQPYHHSPDDTLTAATTLGNSVTMNITQVHPGNDTLQFVWHKSDVSMPPEWVAQICDNSTCYPALLDSGTTLPVLPGDDGLLLIHCTPYTTPGTGVIRYTMYEIHTPWQVDTLTWIIQAEDATGIPTAIQSPIFSISGNTFQLSSSSTGYDCLKWSDTSGKELFRADLNGTSPIRIPDLPAAVYLLQLSGNRPPIQQRIWFQTPY